MALEEYSLFTAKGEPMAVVELPQEYNPGVIVWSQRYFVPGISSNGHAYYETTVAWAPVKQGANG